MQIIHPINRFLFDLFPNANENDASSLISVLEQFYTVAGIKPTVEIDGEFVRVTIDFESIRGERADFERATSLCEAGKLADAKPILQRLTEQNPTNSEYHRVLGQVYAELGEPDEAVNSLIDALRWDRQNTYALIMMGNLFARHYNDHDTALKYYQEVLVQKPDDFLALNNIGSALLQGGKTEQGIEFLEKARDANPSYPNSSYGLAVAWQQQRQPLMAFQFAVEAYKSAQGKDKRLADLSLLIMKETTEEYLQTSKGRQMFEEYKSYLERESGKQIKSESAEDLPTAAKLEIAENHSRPFHVIRFNQQYPAVEHLQMHELVHLDFVLEARKEKANMLFLHGNEQRHLFFYQYESEIKKLVKSGYSEQSVANVFQGLYEGIGRQLYNTPIDLFIEDFLFEHYADLQPFQFASLQRLIGEGLQAINHKDAKRITPAPIYKASKVLNIVNAIQFRDLYGVDLVTKFAATPQELKEANKFWEEYKEYRKDRKPGEEYELVQHWMEDLGFEPYFQLVDEIDFRSRTTDADALLEELEEDPLSADSDKNFKERSTETFLKNQAAIGVNMAVVMYMVDALQYFDNKTLKQIKDIAIEIAMIGTQGIDPQAKQPYKVRSIGEKEFSGYHLLAYYYVSWALAIPEMLDQLQLPYKAEYEMARTMQNPKTP